MGLPGLGRRLRPAERLHLHVAADRHHARRVAAGANATPGPADRGHDGLRNHVDGGGRGGDVYGAVRGARVVG
jgi:hypothetical protein